MDRMMVWLYFNEMRREVRYASLSYEEMLSRFEAQVKFGEMLSETNDLAAFMETKGTGPVLDNARHIDVAWVFLHAFLSHAAIISKILWPGPPRPPLTQPEMTDRGRVLRDEFDLHSLPNIANRDLRDHIEHYAERLQAWDKVTGRLTDRPFLGYSVDPRAGTATVDFEGTTFDLAATWGEIRQVDNALRTWYERETKT